MLVISRHEIARGRETAKRSRTPPAGGNESDNLLGTCKIMMLMKNNLITKAQRKIITFTLHFPSGPVFVEFPIDVLYPYHLVKKEIGMKGGPSGFVQRIINW